MGYQYHTKNGEDYLLWQLFQYKPAGFFVDVGAFDGIFLSNTYSFAQQGWRGMCIEPHPEYFPRCQAARPESLCLNLACVGDARITTVDFFSEKMGLLSSISVDREDDIQQRYARRGLQFEGMQKISVSASTLNAVLKRYYPDGVHLDLVSIDVEGAEIEVLKGFDCAQYAPTVIVIEGNTDAKRQAIRAYLEQEYGYIEAITRGVNMFFVRTAQEAHVLRELRVHCAIEPQEHPLGLAYTPKWARDGKVINE